MIRVAVPTRGSINFRVVWALLQMSTQNTLEKKVDFEINKNVESAGVNRNQIVRSFLKSTATHLLMIDDDTCPPLVYLEDLVALDKDILVLPYPLNMNTSTGSAYYWSVFPEAGMMTSKRGKGLQKIYAAGTGFMLIRRNVLETIPNPFSMQRGDDDSIIKQEDYFFCEKANNAGFEVWVDWSKPCSHLKETDLLELI